MQQERRTDFRKFIRGGGYRLPKNKWMSYRELAEALGGIGGHTKIRSWMTKDFPRIYQDMGDESNYRFKYWGGHLG